MASNNIRKFKRPKDDDAYGIVAKKKPQTTNRSKLASNKGANNIKRLKDSGHKTDYTGGFILDDKGKLTPVLGIKKAKANKITRFGKSGHMLIPGSGGAKYDVVPIIDPTKKSKKNKRKNKKYTA